MSNFTLLVEAMVTSVFEVIEPMEPAVPGKRFAPFCRVTELTTPPPRAADSRVAPPATMKSAEVIPAESRVVPALTLNCPEKLLLEFVSSSRPLPTDEVVPEPPTIPESNIPLAPALIVELPAKVTLLATVRWLPVEFFKPPPTKASVLDGSVTFDPEISSDLRVRVPPFPVASVVLSRRMTPAFTMLAVLAVAVPIFSVPSLTVTVPV